MAKYSDRPGWWNRPEDKVAAATNPFTKTGEEDAAARERIKEIHRQMTTSTPSGSPESEFERMMRQDFERTARDSMARVHNGVDVPMTYDDTRRTQRSMEQRRGTISIPSLESDSEIKRTIKEGIRLNISKHMTAADPYGETTRFNAEFVLKARVDFTYRDDSSNIIKYEHLTSGVEDEILKLAREIVRERKGMI